MKKFTRMICACMIVALSVTSAFAAGGDPQTIEPAAEKQTIVNTEIYVSGDTLKLTGKITGNTKDTDSVSVHLYLQRNRSGRWVTVDDWIKTSDTYYCILTKTKTATKGNQYRSKAVCTAFAGDDKEVITKYSKTVKC